jgi:hypothetical protein
VREERGQVTPYAYLDSRDPNPPEERKKAIKMCQQYDQETQD